MIQSNYGRRRNFDLVVPRSESKFANYWRDNNDPILHWYEPFNFGSATGIAYETVSLIQSNFGIPGNLEIVARCEYQLIFFGGTPDLILNGTDLSSWPKA